MYACVPIACPKRVHPSVKMFSGFRIIAKFVSFVSKAEKTSCCESAIIVSFSLI